LENKVFEFWGWFCTNEKVFEEKRFSKQYVRELCFEYGFRTHCLDITLDKEKIEQEFSRWFIEN